MYIAFLESASKTSAPNMKRNDIDGLYNIGKNITLRKGIYKIVDTYLNKTLSVGASEDINQLINNMNAGIMPSRRCERYRFKIA